jgi:hypothetical protein
MHGRVVPSSPAVTTAVASVRYSSVTPGEGEARRGEPVRKEDDGGLLLNSAIIGLFYVFSVTTFDRAH